MADLNVSTGRPISKKELVRMAMLFKEKYPEVIKANRSVWFSIDDLYNILKLINNQGQSSKPTGVRLYLGLYPQNTPGDRAGKWTIMFLPTSEKDGKHQENIDEKDIEEAMKNLNDNENITDSDDGYNHGELCPPNCGTLGEELGKG